MTNDITQRRWRGVVATVLLLGILFALRLSNVDIPNPGTVVALAIVYASFTGGVGMGLLSAALGIFGTALYLLLPTFNLEALITISVQLAVVAFCLPTIAILVGRLKNQVFKLAMEQEAERTHRAAEVRYQRLVNSIKDYAILMTDPRGIIRSWNEGAERIKGYKPDEIIGKNISVFYTPEEIQAGKVEVELRVATETGRYEDEGWRVRKDGSRFWANVVLTAIRDPITNELQGFVKVTRDLSDRRAAEENLRQKGIALEAANKELEAFSYSVSHDLRAPLRGIDGFSQALLEDYQDKLDEDGRDYLQRIRAGTQRMGHLIDDLLNLSRLTRGEMRIQKVDLTSISKQIIEDLKSGDPIRQAEVSVQDELRVQADNGLMTAVLENLLSNAWKFTSKQPLARIEVGKTEMDGKTVFYVKDNGAGFDMTYANKLFGAFQRLHRADEYAGNGVGLATVRRIIHRHGGEIWVNSGVNQGATFYFTLGTSSSLLRASQSAA